MRRNDNLATFMCRLSRNYREPWPPGALRACPGLWSVSCPFYHYVYTKMIMVLKLFVFICRVCPRFRWTASFSVVVLFIFCTYILRCLACIVVSYLVCICCTVCIAVFTLDAGLLARSQYPEGPATGHLDTGSSWFPCVRKQTLRWFPRSKLPLHASHVALPN